MRYEEMNDSRFKSGIVATLILSILFPAVGSVIVHMFFPENKWIQAPFHAVVEAIGAFAATALAIFMLIIWKSKKDFAPGIWVSCALIAAAVMDAFHASISPGDSFVWLHSAAVLFGGFIFALAWLPERISRSQNTVVLPALVTVVAVILSALSIIFSDAIPSMINQGVFTPYAKTMNIIGGAFFILAAAQFLIRYRNNDKLIDLLFANLAILFGFSGLLFEFSSPWDANWWFWHLLRLLAFFLALGYVLITYQKTVEGMEVEIVERNLSEEKFRTLFDSATDGILLADVETKKQYMVNKKICEMLGYSHEEMLNLKAMDIHPENDIPWIMEVFDKQARGEITLIENIPLKRKDGSVIYTDINASPVNIGGKLYNLGIFRDSTERREAENKIRESEAKNRAILEAIPDMILRFDREGVFVGFKASKEVEALMPPSDFLGRKMSEVLPPHLAEQTLQYSDKALMTGKTQTFTYDLTLKGYSHHFEARIAAAGNNEFICLVRDVTETKRTDDMRRENERLALANRAKSEFLTVMSHELRTPLNAIIGFSELLKKKDAGELNEKQQRYADNVHSSGKHLLSIIDDILDLTRVESGKMEFAINHVSVPAAVNEVLEDIKEKARKQNIIIKKDLTEIEFIDTDEQKFRQVLNNLLDNAVKFSKPEGGTVTITAEKEGDMAKFSVSDTGIGIKEENIGRLFRGFEQLDAGIARKYGGTGLGLAVSKKLVELLGGRITVESRYGEGSTFTFTLPIVAKKQEGT